MYVSHYDDAYIYQHLRKIWSLIHEKVYSW